MKSLPLSALKLSLTFRDKFTGVEGTKIPDTDVMSSGSKKCDAYLWLLTSI